MDEKKEKLKAIRVYLPADQEQQFRKNAMVRYGYARGSISMAATDAIARWNAYVSVLPHHPKMKDPVTAIEGMLAHVKKTSVELQHEASGIRAQRALHYLKKRA